MALPPRSCIAVLVIPETGESMKQRIKALFAGGVLVFALFGVAAAGTVDDGQAAYLSGDYAKAMRLWLPLAIKGDAEVQNLVGSLYKEGQGVPKDYVKAATWFRKGANQGNANAEISLGWMCVEGYGVPKDDVKAYMWYDLAASSANDAETRGRAVSFRDNMLGKFMKPAQIAEAQRMAREWKPKK
jgi:uncharacterized protein